MENTLILLQKVYDTFAYLYQTLQLYPKSEKYALAAETKKSCIHVLELVAQQQKDFEYLLKKQHRTIGYR